MKINGKHYRTIWIEDEQVQIIDQRFLPHELVIETLRHSNDFAAAIKEMHVRGAPLIGVTAAYGLYTACKEAPDNDQLDTYIQEASVKLSQTRPTAVDLFHALEAVNKAISPILDKKGKINAALNIANQLAEESVASCRMIGEHGLPFIEACARANGNKTVNILTHCNAGWMACIDHGTATAPIYAAFDKGIDVHVWVDETRPRNQGARITAFELLQHGIPHTVIPDNTGGHLMQHGLVDMVLVGSDRTTITGDVANKIGTYLKALAAKDNEIPFYVALPSSSFDWKLRDGLKEIEIEQRDAKEIKWIQGRNEAGQIQKVLLTPENSPATNYGFDVTPARLVSAIITERGVCNASEQGILELYPEKGGI